MWFGRLQWQHVTMPGPGWEGCNEGASNITQDRPTFVKLKTQVLRSTNETQLELLAVLIRKFPKQAGELIG